MNLIKIAKEIFKKQSNKEKKIITLAKLGRDILDPGLENVFRKIDISNEKLKYFIIQQLHEKHGLRLKDLLIIFDTSKYAYQLFKRKDVDNELLEAFSQVVEYYKRQIRG